MSTGKHDFDNYDFPCQSCSRMEWRWSYGSDYSERGWYAVCKNIGFEEIVNSVTGERRIRTQEVRDVKRFTHDGYRYYDWEGRIATGELWPCDPIPTAVPNPKPVTALKRTFSSWFFGGS